MQRILHINDYPADTGGGAEVVMGRAIELLRKRGLSVSAFTAADLAGGRLTPWRYIDNGIARRALAAKLVAFRPVVVHLHNYYHVLSPGILAVLANYKQQTGLRVVMTAHDYHLACPNSGGCSHRWWGRQREPIDARPASFGFLLTRRWDHRSAAHSVLKLMQYTWNYRWQQRQRVIDLLICPSRFVQAMLQPTGLQTCWLPHPAPTASARPRRREGPLRLVYAGRIDEGKGLDDFLQALPADFPGTLTVIGSGELLPRCRAICAAQGLEERVHFVGRLPHAETLARIADCHVLVQPSRLLETYGLTLIEALAVGTNVLASERGASREIVEDSGVGFLYDVANAESLSAALGTVLHRHTAGTLNNFDLRPFLNERSESAHVEALLALYEAAWVQRAAA